MKKNLLIISTLFLGAFAGNAQITITSADISVPPKMIQQAHDTVPGTITAGSAGILQTWNMTALGTDMLDTLNFIVPTWSSYSTNFPTSNLGLYFMGQNAYGFTINNSTSLSILGNATNQDFGGGPSDIIQKNTPAEIISTFPSTYLTTFTNNFTTNALFRFGVDPGVGFTIDSVRQKTITNKTSLVDAWGNITTPLGTYASLRYYTVKHTTDSLWVKAFSTWTFFQETIDSAKDYSWWANGIGFSLVDMHVDQITGTVKTIDWLKAMPTAGINEYTASTSVNVYPNPAQNEIHFAMDASKAAFIEVYDITGRSVTTIAVTSDNSGINTSSFANGQYSYSVLGKDRSILNRGKFTVIR